MDHASGIALKMPLFWWFEFCSRPINMGILYGICVVDMFQMYIWLSFFKLITLASLDSQSVTVQIFVFLVLTCVMETMTVEI